MNKRILILVNHDLVIYNFRKELVKELISEGFEVYVSSPDGDRIPELITMGCKVIKVKNIERHGKNPFKELKLLSEYKKLIKKLKPLCVLTYTIKPNIFGSIASDSYSIPCLSNITGLGSAVEKRSLLQHITIQLYKYAFRKIHTVFFQNKENMDFFINNKISNLTNYELLPGSGVNLDEFKPLKYPDSGIIKFVFISRIMKEKGIDVFLEAAEYIKKKYPSTEFHICGFCEENYEDKIKNYEENNIVIYHGMVKDIPKILSNIHCTVHPTYYPEGLSNVLLESSACARPIITTDRSGCREVVTKKNGYLIYPNNTESLIEKIEKFIMLSNNEREQMGVLGRQLVEEQFDRKLVVNSYIEKIKEIEAMYNDR